MRPIATYAWQSPLTFAAAFQDQDIALLYSGRSERYSGQTSYLFLEPLAHCRTSRWSELPVIEDTDAVPQWVGYLGYGMRHELERYTRNAPSIIDLPDCWLTQYARVFRFDHAREVVEEFGWQNQASTSPQRHSGLEPESIFLNVKSLSALWRRDGCRVEPGMTAVSALRSNFTRTSYEASVKATLEKIRDGDFYQANITRKFYGEFTQTPQPWSVFDRLCAASPAPYSAFIRHGDTAILSSSPECFLRIDADGRITSRPIKGSARRGVNALEDKKIAEMLLASEKNIAENRMIVDLMRHDFSRVGEAGSVHVEEQSALYSYATIHHLVSTITAQKRDDQSTYDVVRACFPPGSMTGAPKIAAVEWCAAQERLERGVYSGAIGWFGGQQTCDLSVVIRTLILQGNRFEFQVGGGIVADSNPTEEWQETLVKARGIAQALGIDEEKLATL